MSLVQLIFCKDNANERNESLLSNCRVQLIFCKDNAFSQNSKGFEDKNHKIPCALGDFLTKFLILLVAFSQNSKEFFSDFVLKFKISTKLGANFAIEFNINNNYRV